MIISYPASPSRIIVLLKTLRHIFDNLTKKCERRERSIRENRKKGIIFRANAISKKGAKTFRCFALEKSAEYYLSALGPVSRKSRNFSGVFRVT